MCTLERLGLCRVNCAPCACVACRPLQPNLPCYKSNLAIHERLGRTLLRSGYFLVRVVARVRGRRRGGAEPGAGPGPRTAGERESRERIDERARRAGRAPTAVVFYGFKAGCVYVFLCKCMCLERPRCRACPRDRPSPDPTQTPTLINAKGPGSASTERMLLPISQTRACTCRRLCTCKADSGCWHAPACRNWSNFRHRRRNRGRRNCRQTCPRSTFVGTRRKRP